MKKNPVLYVVEAKMPSAQEPELREWNPCSRQASVKKAKAQFLAHEMRRVTASIWKYRVAKYVRKEGP